LKAVMSDGALKQILAQRISSSCYIAVFFPLTLSDGVLKQFPLV